MYMVAVYVPVYMGGEADRDWGGVMCFPDSQSPQGKYSTHNNPHLILEPKTGSMDI